MRLTRKHALLFLAIAGWNLVTYANFARNLTEGARDGADRPTAYYVAHVVLIVVNLAIAAVLARLGVAAWRAAGPGVRGREAHPALDDSGTSPAEPSRTE
jgi:hypothetical protein